VSPVFVHAPPNVKHEGFVHRLTVFCELILTRFLPSAAAPDSNDGTDVAYTT